MADDVRRHLKVVRALGAGPLPTHPLVLRGGLALRVYVGAEERPVDDVDFLSDDAFDEAVAAVHARLAEGFALESCETIWEETDHPGRRWSLAVDGAPLQLDLGFGDPRTQAERVLPYPGAEDLEVRIPAPETFWAWKVHGLFERGDGRWRAKDFWDLHLLARHGLDAGACRVALATAFASRGDDFTLMDRFLEDPAWGSSRGSRRKWRYFFERHLGREAPDMDAFVANVRGTIRAAT